MALPPPLLDRQTSFTDGNKGHPFLLCWNGFTEVSGPSIHSPHGKLASNQELHQPSFPVIHKVDICVLLKFRNK